MLRLATAVTMTISLLSGPAIAQTADAAKLDDLFNALGMPEIIAVMRDEGLEYGATLATDMLPGGPSNEWADAVSAIYDPQMMFEEVRGAFGEALEGDDIDAMLGFFTTPPGTTIVDLEVSARRAMLDDAVETAAIEAATLAMLDETPRAMLLQDFVAANDLIESNVVGAMNSSFAFYNGLIDGGAMPAGVTTDTALQDVWAQEDEIRATTTQWVYAFLMMAYQPLSDAELQAYIAFSETEAGQDLTDALFTSLDGMFNDISRGLGLAASRFMVTQEL